MTPSEAFKKYCFDAVEEKPNPKTLCRYDRDGRGTGACEKCQSEWMDKHTILKSDYDEAREKVEMELQHFMEYGNDDITDRILKAFGIEKPSEKGAGE